MRNIMLTVAYDGTNYSGYQRQKNGIAIEDVIEKSLSKVLKQDIRLYSASRTDKGVHAREQVVNFMLDSTIKTERIPLSLIGHLPDDIIVTGSKEMPMDFHSRYSSTGKWYRYTLRLDDVASPFDMRFTWYYPGEFDIERVRASLPYIIGDHDYRVFCAAGSDKINYCRTIYNIYVNQEISNENHYLYIDFYGSGFLYKMIRTIVGTLMDIGRGKYELRHMEYLMNTHDRNKIGITAPACGLCLMKIFYYNDEMILTNTQK